MKRKSCLLIFAALFAAITVCVAAEEPNMGTWKLDEAKSKISAGAPKNTTVVYEAAGESVKVTVDGVDGSGKPSHNEWTGKFDGKDYALTGDPTADMRSYKRINTHTLVLTNKKSGKTILTARVEVSADGKTRTVTASGNDATGKKMESTMVYNKQ